MKNFRKKVIIFIVICAICLLVLLIAIASRKTSSNFSPVLQGDIKTMEELCSRYNIKLIKEVDSSESDYDKQIFVEFPYDTTNDNGTSSRSYYEEVINLFAQVYDYDNLIVLDDSKAIKIEIKCYKKSQSINSYTINGDKFYFENLEKKLEVSKISKIELKDIKVESSILKNLINNSWNENSVNFGTKDSEIDNYNIYFDEGIEVRTIEGKVFNIVFNQNYLDDVIEGVNTKTNLDAINQKYGESSFKNIGKNIGYKTKDLYIFFADEQISIYRVDIFDTEEFSKLVSEFIQTKDEKKFVDQLKKIWPDFDKYEENTRYGTIELTYTLKGVKFNINVSKEHGVTLYNNFNGKITNDVSIEQILKNEKEIPDYTYIKNEDLILKYEIERNYGIHNYKNNYDNYNSIYEDYKDKNINTFYSNEDTDFARQSSKFFCMKENGTLRIFSRYNEYPPLEIKNNYCFLWIDDTHLIYSIYKKGIYIYNAVTRNITPVKEGNEKFKINNYDKDGYLDYDDEIIECSID